MQPVATHGIGAWTHKGPLAGWKPWLTNWGASVGVRRISAPRHFMVLTFSPDIFLARREESGELVHFEHSKFEAKRLFEESSECQGAVASK